MSEGLRVGIAGNGAREAAMAAVFESYDEVGTVIGLGRNLGIDSLRKGHSVHVDLADVKDTVRAVDEFNLDVLFIGPELPLTLGLVNEIEAWNAATGSKTAVLGPTKEAAIEKSKIDQRMLWEICGLNAGLDWRIFAGSVMINDALKYIEQKKPEYSVIKPDRSTAGKGVILPKDMKEAEIAIEGMLSGRLFNGAGQRLIIEGRWNGPEVSATFLSDGNGSRVELPYTQDHKRLRDTNEEGSDNPNTGGMGSYSPVPPTILKDYHRQEIRRGVALAQDKMTEQGRPVKGLWYEAEMLGENAVHRLEVNSRGGDTETQTMLWAMKHAGINVFELYYSAARGELSFTQDDLLANIGVAAVTLTCAAEGYATADKVTIGDKIFGLWEERSGGNVHIDFAAIKKTDEGNYVTNGGRVLSVTAVGATLEEARKLAYASVGENGIHWRGMIVRNTIARQAISPYSYSFDIFRKL